MKSNIRMVQNLVFLSLSIWTAILILQELAEADIGILIGLILGVALWVLFVRSRYYDIYATACIGFLFGYHDASQNWEPALDKLTTGGTWALVGVLFIASLRIAIDYGQNRISR